ncbi:MAG: hypothetical protein JWO82_2355 [Akkermansiaceae bacterium]|nr:hypothetical protein [Akkermansiaceae bacterium]
MKPRITLAEVTLPSGEVLSLQEHDSRYYLQTGGVQIAGPATARTERELANIACAPCRSARQPKVWIAGLGLGELLAGVAETLQQKRGVFIVAEPQVELVKWQREFFPDSTFSKDPRVEVETDVSPAALHQYAGTLNAVLVHADTAPLTPRGKLLIDDARWIGAAYDALQPGGLLGIGCSRPIRDAERRMARAGFEVVRHEIDAIPNARRPRLHFVWLGRKGSGQA